MLFKILYSVQEHHNKRIRAEIKMEKITKRACRTFYVSKELRPIRALYTQGWRILFPFIFFIVYIENNTCRK